MFSYYPPLWPRRPWFLRMLSLLVEIPKRLPVFPGLLHQPLSQLHHQDPNRLHLTLWHLSGSRVRRQAFLKELPLLQRNVFGPQLDVLTIPDWQVFVYGAPVRRVIHVQHL